VTTVNTDYLKRWAKAAAIRAIKTMAQTAVALIPVGVSITDVTWPMVLGTAALAGVCSLLTSVAGLPEVDAPEEVG
jgi:hypothetical protein